VKRRRHEGQALDGHEPDCEYGASRHAYIKAPAR